MKKMVSIVCLVAVSAVFFSCASNKKIPKEYLQDEQGGTERQIRPISRSLSDKGTRTAAELAALELAGGKISTRDCNAFEFAY